MCTKVKQYINKRYFSLILILLLIVSCCMACGKGPDNNGSMKSDDGRSYGGIIEGELGKTVKTVFFDLTVDSAKKCNTYQFQDGLYIADPSQIYLEVTVTIKNTYNKDLPMSISDFTLDYSENSNSELITGYGRTELGLDEYMDNIFTLKKDETVTTTILFIVVDRAAYLFCYKEYYEDKFEGDTYEITMVPEVLEPAVTTEEATEAVDDNEAPTDVDDGENSTENPEGSSDLPDGESNETDESKGETSSSDNDTGIIEQ